MTGSPWASSIYVARTIDGAALPAPLIQHERYEMVLLADTIRLAPFGIGERISIHRDTPSGGPTSIDTTRYTERYVVRGDSLRFYRYCPPDANCVAPPEGAFSADRRWLILRLWAPGQFVEYERVSS
jgi:hypothetical protein